MRLAQAISISTLLLLATVWPDLTSPAAAQEAAAWWRPAPREAGLPANIQMRAAGDVTEKVEVARESLQEGRLLTEPVSDLLIRLRPEARRYRSSPGLPTAAETVISVRINAVTHGRIGPTSSARCESFEGDVLICNVDCGGGVFGLRRGGANGEHYLIVGISEGARGGGSRDQPRSGFRLGGCGTAEAGAPILVPRGSRLSQEIRLLEFQ